MSLVASLPAVLSFARLDVEIPRLGRSVVRALLGPRSSSATPSEDLFLVYVAVALSLAVFVAVVGP